MSCFLTQGFVNSCRNNTGGVKSVYFASFSNIGTPSIVSGSLASTGSFFVSGSGGRFYQYQQRKQVADFVETATVSEPNGTVYYDQVVTVQLPQMSANVRNELVQLAQNSVMAIVQDNNGNYWLAGSYAGLDLNAGKSQTGKNYGDLNGYILPFHGMEQYPMVQVPSGSIAGLLIPY